MSEPYVMSAALCRRRTGAQGSLPEKACEADSMGLLLRLFFFIGAIKTTNTPTVMRRHREDIFHTTCTACKDLDRRGDNFSVTLSGASAESKGLEFAEHAPVRFVRIYANPPSGPLDCARDDSLCCHVERSDSEVETSRLDGTFTFSNHTRNAQNAETNINDRSRCSIIPRLERGTPAVDGFVTYHSTFSSLDGGAFHPLRAILHTNGRHALILSAIPGGHAIFENSSTLYIGTSAEEVLCARIECLASAERSPFYHTFGEACPLWACRFNRAFP